jgi:hypothetical protein
MGFPGWAGDSAPATGMFKITKSDSTPVNCRALLVGTAGTANITTLDGNACTDVPLQQGYNPIACRLVNTGGTADNIWALI